MSILTIISFTEKETDAFPARALDNRVDDGMIMRRSLERMDVLPMVGDEIVIALRLRLRGTPIRTWYGRKKKTFTERLRTVTLKLHKVTHDMSTNVVRLDCVFVKEDAA